MMIDSVYELCEDICDFHDMLVNGCNTLYQQADTLWGNGVAIEKARLLNNILDDFSNIAQFAERYIKENDDTL